MLQLYGRFVDDVPSHESFSWPTSRAPNDYNAGYSVAPKQRASAWPAVKLAFQGADTDTDTDSPNTASLTSDTRCFLARMSVRDARVYTCTCVLYTMSYIVYTFTKLHDRRIPNVGVGVRVVGPVEFQLKATGSEMFHGTGV